MKFMDKKQYSKILLSIDSGRIILFTLKKKDEIDLKEGEVALKTNLGLTENNKYMFTLSYKKKGLIISTIKRLTLGTDSESSRRDWVFSV
jgi:hypothetical protein